MPQGDPLVIQNSTGPAGVPVLNYQQNNSFAEKEEDLPRTLLISFACPAGEKEDQRFPLLNCKVSP